MNDVGSVLFFRTKSTKIKERKPQGVSDPQGLSLGNIDPTDSLTISPVV